MVLCTHYLLCYFVNAKNGNIFFLGHKCVVHSTHFLLRQFVVHFPVFEVTPNLDPTTFWGGSRTGTSETVIMPLFATECVLPMYDWSRLFLPEKSILLLALQNVCKDETIKAKNIYVQRTSENQQIENKLEMNWRYKCVYNCRCLRRKNKFVERKSNKRKNKLSARGDRFVRHTSIGRKARQYLTDFFSKVILW